MDKYIKFPVPINKKNVNWDAEYMYHGGSQLIEILEKEISHEELLAARYNFSQSQMDRLGSWLSHDCDISKVAHELNVPENLAKSFFYRGAGMLAKLYQTVDVTPVIEDEQFISRFSFINYNVIKTELGYVVKSEINVDKWSNRIPSNFENQFMIEYYLYDREYKRLDCDGKLGQELLDAVKVMNALIENI